MSNTRDEHSDSEDEIRDERYMGQPVKSPFDDAFSDEDDRSGVPEFSPAAIREELAKTYSIQNRLTQDEVAGFAMKVGFSVDPYLSPPPVEAGEAEPEHSLSAPPTMQRTPSDSSERPAAPSHQSSFYEVQLSSSTSELNLQDSSPSPPVPVSPPQPSQSPGESHSADYPSVYIDASRSQAEVTEVYSEPVEHTNGLVVPARPASLEDVRARSVSPRRTPPRSAPNVISSSVSHLPLSSSQPTSSSHASVSHISAPPVASAFRRQKARSMGPSVLDRVVSKTRPTFLPPKPRDEDRKHMADWEQMMKRSRAAEEKRRKALEERRYSREKKIDESIGRWEREIVPDWTVVNRNPALRKLWWAGIPTKLRATMWQNAVGNTLVLSKDAYKTCLARAKRALNHASFPTTVLGLIEEDIKTTLPSLHLFAPGVGPMYEDLKDMLCAWVVSRSDEGLGYLPGIAKIAAMLLLNMAAAQGFVVMRNLLERHCLRSFFGGLTSKDDVEAYYRIFDTLLADGMPKIYFNFKQHQVSPAAYLPDWLIPLFLDHLPFEACARLWDILLLEGDSFLFRASLAILAVLEPRLFFPDRRELLELLKYVRRT
ncbi:hypothetical protein EVJ58_g2726 [Rhodofomes roseus]|uniref:Rab-GAP TBC domain-containing protein n=1 Tax=Rhodofomes roseus TaxID=34475 RepID=A0A4Y9YPD4_9APHY|nr:hypothetical protein EVJ58_g2726 [Rhodofomes roseus]